MQVFNFDSAIMYFNYSIIIIIALGAISGFFKGLFKSTYNFIVFMALLLIGWFLSPLFIKTMMGFNFNINFNYGNEALVITTLNEFIPNFIAIMNPKLSGIFSQGSLALELLNEFIFMAFRIIFIIVWLILMATIFKFGSWIIYLFIKPKKKKKGMVSRLGGLAVGTLHAVIFVILISIPLSGLTSIASSLITFIPEEEQVDELSYQLIITENEPILLADGSNPLDLSPEVLDFINNYRGTYSGKLASYININGTYIDEYAFDQMFSVKFKDNRVKFRYELKTALSIYKKLTDNIEGEITLDKILALDDTTLNQILEDVSSLQIIEVAIPVALEVATTSAIIDENLRTYTENYNLEEILDAVIEMNMTNEVKFLGNTALAAFRLGLFNNEEGTKPNFLELDPVIVKSLFENLGSSEIVALVSDLGIDYAMQIPGVVAFFAEQGIDINSIDVENINWKNEITNLGNVYEAFRNISYTQTVNPETGETELSLSDVTDQQLNQFAIAMYTSQLFSENSSEFVKVLISKIPPEYQEMITVNQFDVNDLTSVLCLGKVLATTGILKDGADPALLLSDTNIEKIATYISESQLISSNVQGIIEMLLSNVFTRSGFEITIPEDMVWYGDTGKNELISLFTTANKLVDMELAGENFANNLTPENIEELSNLMVESRVLMHNVDNLLAYFLSDATLTGGIEISIREMDWTTEEGKTEFKNILKAISVIYEANLLNNPDFTTLSDGTVDTNGDEYVNEFDDNILSELASALSSSIVIKDNLSNIINQVVTTQTSEITITPFTNSEDWTYLELHSLLKSVKIILTKTNLPEDLFTLSETELDSILGSRLISEAMVSKITELAADGNSLDDLLIVEEVSDWYDTYDLENNRTDGELRKLFNSASILLGDNPNFDDPSNLIQTNNILTLSDGSIDPNDDKLGELLRSKVLKDSLVNQIIKNGTDKTDEFGNVTEEAILIVNLTKEDPIWDQEIRSFIKAIKIFLGDTVDLTNITINNNLIADLSTGDVDPADDEVGEILKSVIITDTIINQILKLSNPTSGTEAILKVNLTADDSRWRDSETEDGEIRKLVRAIKLILGDTGDINDPNAINIDKILTFSNTEYDILVDSIILVDTAVAELKDLTKPAEGLTPAGSLNTILYLPPDDEINYYGSDGELKKFLIAIDVILAGGTIETANFEVKKFFGEDQETLLASRIVEESVIMKIESESTTGGSLENTLVFPTNFVHDDWYGQNGELRKFLAAIEIIIGTGTFETTNFAVDKFLGTDQEVLLDSRIVEASVIKYIKDTDKLIIPDQTNVTTYYYFENETITWERTYVGGVLTDTGELRRFLTGVKEVIGGGTFESFIFTMDNMLTTNFAVVLESRVLEATVANMINDLLLNTLNGFIATPINGNQWYYHASSSDLTLTGEVRRGEFRLTDNPTYQRSDLQGFLKSIQEMETAGLSFDGITLQAIASCDSTLLATALYDYSRIMRGSIATMLNRAIVLAGLSPIFTDASFQTKQEVINGLNLLDSFV